MSAVKKVNWSVDERDMLINKCEDSTVATGKFSSSLTAADKSRFWTEVTESINSVSKVTRSIDQVKKKWIDLKSQTKKKTIAHLQDTRKTGGGPAPVLGLEEWESKVLQTIPSCSVEGIPNGTDTFFESVDDKAQPSVDSITAYTEKETGVIGSKADNIKTTETESQKKRHVSDDASTSKAMPVAKKAKSDRNSVEELVLEQTSVMQELVVAVKALTDSVNILNSNLKKEQSV